MQSSLPTHHHLFIMTAETYVFRTHVDTEYGRDIPSSWFYVIATSKEEAQDKALEYITSVNDFRSRYKTFSDCNTFICRAVFEHVVPYGHLNTSAINYEPA